MAKITLNIGGNIEDIQSKIATIKKDLQSIGTQGIKIKVDSSGLKSLDKDQLSVVRSANQRAAAEAKAVVQAEKAATAEAKLAHQMEKAAQATERAAQSAAQEESSLEGQKAAFNDATRAVKEYYSALSQLNTSKTDIRLTEKGWASESGNWDALAAQLNRVTTAFNALTSAENVNNLTEEQQISLKQLMAQKAEEFAVASEKAGNKAAEASAKAANGLDAESRAAREATLAYEKYVAELEKAAALNPTKLQRQINYAVGLDPDYSHKITAANSMFGSLSDEDFAAYTSGAKSAEEITGKLASTQQKAAAAAKNQSFAQSKVNQDLSNASALTKLLGNTLDVIIAKVVAWQVLNAGVSAVIRSFKEAVQTIKEVDSALVTVQKTTDFNKQQLKSLTDETYKLASAYGRTADELMSLNADFARAGFKDNIAQMTELAALLENVGDLEGQTASKFLLAANAAWQLNGSYDALMGIIDGMNAVTNEAAVDMEGLTTGITVAGSAFAAAGESAQTFTALLGTGIAATQRSGSEVARALRTVLMNVRQIKGELEDGEIIDEESISNAAKALSSIGISVSENGELRKFSDILTELAGKWDALTSAEQSYIAESLGNKRQANTLISILQNYGEYERQLEIYANGAGSALKENAIYLDSWEAKTKKLSAAWTEFISHIIETGTIKSVLDGTIGLVKILDSGIGELAISAAEGAAAASILSKAFEALTGSSLVALVKDIAMLNSGLATVPATAAGAAYATGGLTGAINLLTTALLHNPLIWGAAIAAGIWAITKAVDAFTVTAEEHAKAVDDARSAYESAKKELKDFNAKLAENNKLIEEGEKAGASEAYVKRIKTENSYLEQQIKLQNDAAQAAKRKLAEEARSALTDENYNYREYQSKINANLISYSNHLLKAAQASKEYDAELQKSVQTALDYAGALADAADGADNLTGKDRELYDQAMALAEAYNKFTEEVLGYGKAQNNATGSAEKAADATEDLAEEIATVYENADKLEAQCNAVSSALKDFKEYGNLTTDSIEGLKDAIPELVNLLYDEEGKLTDVGREALLAASKLDNNADAVRYLQREVDRFNVSRTLSQLGIENQAWEQNTAKIKANLFARMAAMPTKTTTYNGITSTVVENMGEYTRLLNAVNQINQFEKKWSNYTVPTSGSGGGGGGGSGRSSSSRVSSSTASEKDEELERLKAIVALEKERESFLESSSAAEASRIDQMRAVQSALHDEAEYIRNTKAYKEAIAKAEKDINSLTAEEVELLSSVTGLSEEWWTWQEKIANIEAELAKQALQAYQDRLSIDQKRLQIAQSLGVNGETELKFAHEVTESYKELLSYQIESGATEGDILDTLNALISALKTEKDLQSSITKELDTQSKKEREIQEKYLSDTVKLRKSDADLAKKLGLSTREVVYYMQRYADAIMEQGKAMQAAGASQAEINQLAVTYLGVLEDIYNLQNGKETTDGQNKHLEYLKDVLTLRNSELSLIEAQDLAESEQIRKYRGILEALEAEGNYQKEIEAAQAEQNQTATEYYNTLKKILSVQQELLDKLVGEALEYLETQRGMATGPLQEQLDLLKKQHDEAKQQREEEGKTLAVEKARLALENAKKQRNVRIYNASSGQWEWVANAKNVQSAEEALLKAQEELAEYQYKLQIDALQSEIDAINKSFDGLRDAIKEAAEGIKSGKKSFEEAYNDISNTMKKLYEEHGVEMGLYMDEATAKFKLTSKEIADTYEQIKATSLAFGEIDSTLQEQSDGISDVLEEFKGSLADGFGALGTELDKADYQLESAALSLEEIADILGLLPGKLRMLVAELTGNADEVKQQGIDEMKANSIAWGGASQSKQEQLEKRNNEIAESIGLYRDDNGFWRDSATGDIAYNVRDQVRQNAIDAMKEHAEEWNAQGTTDKRKAELKKENARIGKQMGFIYQDASGKWYDETGTYQLFDHGGLLKGIGSIKATTRDEAILGPEVTEKIVSTTGNKAVNDVISMLNKITEPQLFGTIGATLSMNGIKTVGGRDSMLAPFGSVSNTSTDNSLTVNVNGLSMPNISSGMTIGELADEARRLGLS